MNSVNNDEKGMAILKWRERILNYGSTFFVVLFVCHFCDKWFNGRHRLWPAMLIGAFISLSWYFLVKFAFRIIYGKIDKKLIERQNLDMSHNNLREIHKMGYHYFSLVYGILIWGLVIGCILSDLMNGKVFIPFSISILTGYLLFAPLLWRFCERRCEKARLERETSEQN